MSPLPAVTSPLLDLPGVRHAFFTRQGGVSSGIHASLNVGLRSDDEAANVVENRRRAAAHFGAPPQALNTCHQIHSATALVAEAPWGQEQPQADGVVSTAPGLICGALAADCAPILFADAAARVVGACHAGWKGALAGIAEATLARMRELGAEPARIVAVIGPCIGPRSYEVGLEFLDRFVADDPASAAFFAPGETEAKRMFDLPGFMLARLAAAGVGASVWTGHDTCAEEELFFSNRRAFQRGEPDFGRLLSAITLV